MDWGLNRKRGKKPLREFIVDEIVQMIAPVGNKNSKINARIKAQAAYERAYRTYQQSVVVLNGEFRRIK